MDLSFSGEWEIWIPAVHPESHELTFRYIDIWIINKDTIIDSSKNKQIYKYSNSYLYINDTWFFICEIRDKCLIIYNIKQVDTTKIQIFVPKNKRSDLDQYSGVYLLIRKGTNIDDVFYRGVSQ